MVKRLGLLLISILFYTAINLTGPRFYENMCINNWIEIYKLTREDILNNKQIENKKIRDYILAFHWKMKYNYGNNFKLLNQKLLETHLSRVGLKIEDLINRAKLNI